MGITAENGTYTIEVTLSGGSGKASVESPAKIQAEDGVLRAEIVWSSPYYGYMEVDGVGYAPVNETGNSIFEIEGPALDTDIPVLAETVAMSEPHEISYTLYFDSETMKPADTLLVPGICLTASVLAAGAVLAWILKRKKR